jgi:hypothetical protein
MSAIKFAESMPPYAPAEVFHVRIDPKISSSYELLRSFYYLLWFPGYFGFNWNALSDCLRDLSWIPCQKVVLVHEALPGLPREELRIYLRVLSDAVLDWSNDDAHELEVIFRASDKMVVEMLLLD